MTTLSGRERRLRALYRDASLLNTRIQIYKRFSTNPESWHRWAFGQLELAPWFAEVAVRRYENELRVNLRIAALNTIEEIENLTISLNNAIREWKVLYL